MVEQALLSAKAMEGINLLQERIMARQWRDYSVVAFAKNLYKTVSELEGISSALEMIKAGYDREADESAPEMDSSIAELNSLIVKMRRNQKMEQDRADRIREKGDLGLDERPLLDDIYSDLEQDVLSRLLKTRYLLERVQLHAGKAMPKGELKGAAGNILSLLELKEKEVQELKRKYEELRNKTFYALVEENSSADMEKELNELSRKVEGERAVMGSALLMHKRQVDELLARQVELDQRLKQLDELNTSFGEKASELITSLKKERDYAKKAVMNIEHESLRLRGEYSRELLGLEREKEIARQEAKEKARREVEGIKKKIIG